jgi:rhamnopyranosyl-N-acetylglucosaminyl-diphospho-decaprenol beta-1,3/1,4-galactofuranosyltransferase
MTRNRPFGLLSGWQTVPNHPEKHGNTVSSDGRVDETLKLAAVVVTYNRSAVLARTLEAIDKQDRAPDSTFVIDNASSDDTAEMLRGAFPGVRCIRLPENRGYPGGLAAGMEAATAAGFDGFWLMDDDSQPMPRALASLEAAAINAPGAGIIGLRGGRLRFGLIRHLHGLEELSRQRRLAAGVYKADFTLVDGALVLGPAVSSAGFPRSDFFMMMEDIEYGWRIRKAGLDVLVLDEELIHREHLGSGGDPEKLTLWRSYYQTRNHVRWAIESRSPAILFGCAARQLRFLAAGLRISDRRGTRVRCRLMGAWHGARGRMGRTLEPGSC